MMGPSHMAIGVTAVSLVLQTANPILLFIGALTALLPDIDMSTSPAGKVFPWASRYLERRFPHRSCTHSVVASITVAIATYSVAILVNIPLNVIHAINVGYFAGWFADAFTRSGIEMFWPNSIRCVMPGNRNLRLETDSPAEHSLVVVLIAITFATIIINANGGMLTQFNRLIGTPTGVEQLYNQKGANHVMIAHIKGVRASDRHLIQDDFMIIQAHGQGFIVRADDGRIYKAGTEPNVQLITEHITADPGSAATTVVEALRLEEEQLAAKLQQFNRNGAMVFISGKLDIDYPEELQLQFDPYEFPTIQVSGSQVTLEAAPLETVQQQLGEQFATGQLQVRSVYTQVSL